MRESTKYRGRKALFGALTALLFGGAGEPETFFETKVRPVLVESCGKCHGAAKQASGLRLDTREGAIEGGVNGPSIVAGEPEQSLLIQAVRQTHEDIKMPPKGKLPADQVEALAAWVKMGAPWPKATEGIGKGSGSGLEHWAFRAVRAATPPAVKDAEWLRTPVDAFILGRLEKEGLKPSAEAEKLTLIKRATYDLTGLPPAAAEVEAYLKDEKPGAYERVVERLLASPRYGERWARHWLDVSRYADTKGYVFTEDRTYPYSYTYRDYVVRSLNEDKPYDEFVVEQLAADRLGPERDRGSLAALGYLTLGRRFLNAQEEIIDDRIDVVCRGLLGLTVSCARCHDHKFDPIPTADYYSLYGVFASSIEPSEAPEIPAMTPEWQVKDYQEKLAGKREAIEAFQRKKIEEVRGDLRVKLAAYLKAAYELGFNPDDPKLGDRARADGLNEGRLKAAAIRFRARLEASKKGHDPVFAAWQAFEALSAGEFSRKAPGLAKGFVLDDPKVMNLEVAKSFNERAPGNMAEVAARYQEILAEAERRWGLAEKGGAKGLAGADWEGLRQALHGEGGLLVVSVGELVRIYDQGERNQYNVVLGQETNLKATHPGSPPRAMVLNDAPSPVEPHVFLRGNINRPGKQVPRQFLEVLSGLKRAPFKEGSGRLEMARAIASKENPLTARVMVNRIWLNHFGSALVTTPSDFGRRSDPPAHPELLDWLADDFMKNGWSIKGVHRRIVLSSTYRQRSEARPEAVAMDPENRLYWKANRRRLDFEALRDSLLAASGALDPKMGGRGTPIAGPPFSARRTIYGFIDRQNLDPLYRTFDFASPDATSPRRIATSVPQQALFFMNSPFVIEQAKHLASRREVMEGSTEERVGKVYQRLFGREPSGWERSMGLAFVENVQGDGGTVPAIWSYGYGGVDEAKGRVSEFHPFPHWSGTAWQMGSTLPHPEGNYLHWHAGGGHVGVDQKHAAILRWRAPRDLAVRVEGALGHEGKEGDGVRGRLVSSRGGVAGDWVARDARVGARVEKLEVKAGEALDFVVDCRGDQGYDSFGWAPLIRELGGGGESWDARKDFHGPGTEGLSVWERYSQVLLLTNEFAFVD